MDGLLSFAEVRPLLLLVRSADEAQTVCEALLAALEVQAALKLLLALAGAETALSAAPPAEQLAPLHLPYLAMVASTAQRLEQQSAATLAPLKTALLKLDGLRKNLSHAIAQHACTVRELEGVGRYRPRIRCCLTACAGERLRGVHKHSTADHEDRDAHP